MFRGISITIFTITAFSAVSWMIKYSVIEKTVIPHINVFGDTSLVPFMMMALLYFFAYVVTGCYVEVARLFSSPSNRQKNSTSSATRSTSSVGKSSCKDTSSCLISGGGGSDESISKMLENVKAEFISRLPGFLMAYVCATVAKVNIQVRIVLSVIYTLSMVCWLFSSIFSLTGLTQLASCMAHVCCFNLFFYSFIPGFSLISGNLGNTFGKTVDSMQSILNRLVIPK